MFWSMASIVSIPLDTFLVDLDNYWRLSIRAESGFITPAERAHLLEVLERETARLAETVSDMRTRIKAIRAVVKAPPKKTGKKKT